MNPGAWYGLALCLVMSHGCADVSSEEAGGGGSGGDAGEIQWVPDVTADSPGLQTAEVAARSDVGSVEGDGTHPPLPAEGDGGALVSAAERSDQSVDAIGEAPADVAGCDGRRFKKCR